MNPTFQIFAQLPAGLRNPASVIAACRAGGIGVINAELERDASVVESQMVEVAANVRSSFGVSIDAIDESLAHCLRGFVGRGFGWLLVDGALVSECADVLAELRQGGVRVLARVVAAPSIADVDLNAIDGLVLKGHEAGGFVGEDSTFVLLQKWLGATALPLYVHGGVTPQTAAACAAVGVAGGVLGSQLLLLDDVRPPRAYRQLFGKLAGSETVAVGSAEHGEYFRVLVRPGHEAARRFCADAQWKRFGELRDVVVGAVDWNDLRAGLLPVGQDICFAAQWAERFGSVAAVLRAVESAVRDSVQIAADAGAISADAPLARALKVRFPIVQGPMTRVSDRAEFAEAVARGGALPMVALALLKGPSLEKVLTESAEALGDRPWGIGLLGFAPKALLDEQLEVALRVGPDYAIIAGGRPDQAVLLEQAGIPSFLHVPASVLIAPFLRGGARRFIFEGRECGGHVGPLSSFVLWSTMVAKLVEQLDEDRSVRPEEVQVLFAGGIHDAVSSAMVQVLAAPLTAKGVNVGILMGSAYLFTQQIVESGAIVSRFQQEVLACDQTVTLASGPGHASRCAYTPFAREFFRTRERLEREGVPGDEGRTVLDDLIIGRLRVASKGIERGGSNGELQDLDESTQHAKGMYMLGQVATLRSELTDIDTLHGEVTDGAAALLEASAKRHADESEAAATEPVDVAIVGIGALLPGATTTDEFWDNILESVHAITEIPRHRWDWRLYFDEDRKAKDKIYSKWGGFLEDLVFDPTRFGMPPRSVSSVDPMQLIALEVAHRALVDAGYADSKCDHSRTSIIIGASGGTGDVGTQYCMRAELPRFVGELPEQVAAGLPEWTEDSFAGILSNVVAGRVANRLNLGGVNCTTDAACASSLASVYQAAHELAGGRADMAIAGGVDTVQGPFGYLCFSQTQALSPRGRCATFDSSGDGIVISEGVAMIALKRLADAERDGDRIYAVIKGVAGSSDGKARGMTAPVPAGQLRAMRRAYAEAGFGPETVGLFEAHGTGTVVGDVAELESTTRLVRDGGGRSHQSVIGSVKTMIGHTKATAGMAGLIKVAMALHRRVLPPHLGVDDPNAVLRDEQCPLYLLSEPRPWLTDGDIPRRAAVSAFGFGGTNFHVVLEEHTQEYRSWLRPSTASRWPAELLVWGADDVGGLVAALERLRGAMSVGNKRVVLRDLAAGLAEHFEPGAETLAIVARSAEELPTTLAQTLACLRGEIDTLPSGVHRGSRPEGADPGKVAVLFSGQGSQYPEMLRELLVHFPVCAETLAKADAVLGDRFAERFGPGSTPSQFVFPRACYDADHKKAAAAALTATDVAQPALGAVDAAALHLMQRLGLRADLFAGHSFGEFVALYAGGAIDFESMLTLAAARGQAIVDAAKTSGVELGTMAAALAPREQVEAVVAAIDDVVIANHNAPGQVVLSGSRAAVGEATRALADKGIRISEFPVAAGFHSPQVRPAGDALRAAIEQTSWASPKVPVYSNTTAKAHSPEVETLKQVMAEHLVRPVEFVAEIEAMYEDGARTFIELGPKAVQGRLVGRILGQRPHLAVSIDRVHGLEGLLGMLAQLLCAGVKLDLAGLFENRATAPRDPYALPDVAVIPKHAWLLNGSGARPAGTPVRQIGVTAEQGPLLVSASAAASAPNFVAPPAPSAPVHERAAAPRTRMPLPSSNPSISTHRSKAPSMTDNDQTMNGYFTMMRQFLETQERVMAMYMRAPASAQPARGRVPNERVLSTASNGYAAMPKPMPAPVAPRAAAPVPPMPSAGTNGYTNKAAAAPGHGVATPAPATNGVAAPTPKTNGVAAAPVTNGAAEPAAGSAAASLDRAALTDLLLGVVEDKTGYPRDMVKLDQNLEADLGIDSIKRIEVASAIVELLPQAHRAALKPSLGELNTQPTLDGMLGIIGSVTGQGGEASAPFDAPEAGVAAESGHPLRYTMVARARPIAAAAARRIVVGHFIVADDALGVADAVERHLVANGCTVARIARDVVADEAALREWIGAQSLADGTLAGIVHLASLDVEKVGTDASPEAWRQQLHVHEKSLFMMLRDFNAALVDGGHVLAASSLGGRFGRDGSAPTDGLTLQGGAAGLLKSQQEERTDLRVKAIDLDPTVDAEAMAQCVVDELALVGGRIEIGYPKGTRTAFHTEASKAEPSPDAVFAGPGRVILATGGGRGVTAEILREVAVAGTTLIITGRRPLPEAEAPELAAATAAELRAQLIAQIRSGESDMSLAEVGRRVQATLATRELRQNIADFTERGATVEYHAVDVTDEASLRALVADVESRCGRVTGILHGAGIIEDKRIIDKTDDSWTRVVETKVMGVLLLQKLVRFDDLDFFAVMSSVAGRYGNSGQADYATANELMNRICSQLRARSGGAVNVMALCWGPWGPTKFGQGMVSAGVEAKFAAKGVYLVSAADGRSLFGGELRRQRQTAVEVICGAGPWEQREASVGEVELVEPTSIGLGGDEPSSAMGALLGQVEIDSQPKGERILKVTIDRRHAYLDAHRIDGVPVLPAAAAVELFAEAGSSLWSGWHVVEVRDCRLLKGIQLEQAPQTLLIEVSPAAYGSSEGFEVTASLRSPSVDGAPPRVHYRCVLRLQQHFEQGAVMTPMVHAERQLSVGKAYDQWLFHGPCFQVIDQIHGLSKAGADSQVRATTPAQWLTQTSAERWTFDPALLDAGPQMAILWARAFRDETVLPTRFGRVVRYREVFPQRMRMMFECLPSASASQVRANVYYLDEDGTVVMLVEDLEGVSSAALNRLAGQQPSAAPISA